MATELTRAEQRTLEACEHDIERGLQNAVDGMHVAAIGFAKVRDEKLYRASHKTFEKYCPDKWKLTHRQVNHLIAHHNSMVRLLEHDPDLGTTVPKITEFASREIRDLPVETQAEIVEAATDDGKSPTAKQLREAREKVAPRENKTYGKRIADLERIGHHLSVLHSELYSGCLKDTSDKVVAEIADGLDDGADPGTVRKNLKNGLKWNHGISAAAAPQGQAKDSAGSGKDGKESPAAGSDKRKALKEVDKAASALTRKLQAACVALGCSESPSRWPKHPKAIWGALTTINEALEAWQA